MTTNRDNLMHKVEKALLSNLNINTLKELVVIGREELEYRKKEY